MKTRNDGTTIETLARECAALAYEQRTEDVDGHVICATEPMAGDWSALETMLGREPTSDESHIFEHVYRTCEP